MTNEIMRAISTMSLCAETHMLLYNQFTNKLKPSNPIQYFFVVVPKGQTSSISVYAITKDFAQNEYFSQVWSRKHQYAISHLFRRCILLGIHIAINPPASRSAKALKSMAQNKRGEQIAVFLSKLLKNVCQQKCEVLRLLVNRSKGSLGEGKVAELRWPTKQQQKATPIYGNRSWDNTRPLLKREFAKQVSHRDFYYQNSHEGMDNLICNVGEMTSFLGILMRECLLIHIISMKHQ